MAKMKTTPDPTPPQPKVPTMTVEPTAGDSVTIAPATPPDAADKPEESVNAEKP